MVKIDKSSQAVVSADIWVERKYLSALMKIEGNEKCSIVPCSGVPGFIVCPFYIVFQLLKLLLLNICKIQPPDLLFLAVFINIYINRYNFSQIFRTCSTLSEKIIFVTTFSFLMDSLKHLPTHPLNSQNLLSMTKVFCFCYLWNTVLRRHLNLNLLLNLKKLKYLKVKKVDQKSKFFVSLPKTLFACVDSFTNQLIFLTVS